jgi:predicted phage tail protein
MCWSGVVMTTITQGNTAPVLLGTSLVVGVVIMTLAAA